MSRRWHPPKGTSAQWGRSREPTARRPCHRRPPDGQWEVRFATGDAVTGWEELCRHALGNTRRCLDILQTEPRSATNPGRQHRLRGDLASHRHNGKELEQWEYEVTSGGRVRYLIDDPARTVWLVYASPRHLKDTDH